MADNSNLIVQALQLTDSALANSIDAEASRIDIFVGKDVIKILDNGEGMNITVSRKKDRICAIRSSGWWRKSTIARQKDNIVIEIDTNPAIMFNERTIGAGLKVNCWLSVKPRGANRKYPGIEAVNITSATAAQRYQPIRARRNQVMLLD